ncbi:GSCOCG00010018001-RA-CDS, partial [Cotesia congregata]
STNHFKKASGVEELQRQLSNAKTRKLFIIETISADIAVVLASILVLRNDDLQRSILICWEILSEDEYFYKNNVATTVIMKILETGILIAVNQTKEQPILLTMAYTLALLFCRARIFKVSLKITKFIDQLLLFINYLNVKSSSSD